MNVRAFSIMGGCVQRAFADAAGATDQDGGQFLLEGSLK